MNFQWKHLISLDSKKNCKTNGECKTESKAKRKICKAYMSYKRGEVNPFVLQKITIKLWNIQPFMAVILGAGAPAKTKKL